MQIHIRHCFETAVLVAFKKKLSTWKRFRPAFHIRIPAAKTGLVDSLWSWHEKGQLSWEMEKALPKSQALFRHLKVRRWSL